MRALSSRRLGPRSIGRNSVRVDLAFPNQFAPDLRFGVDDARQLVAAAGLRHQAVLEQFVFHVGRAEHFHEFLVYGLAKKDAILLGPNCEVEVFVEFRDFKGSWVFHCHNIEHEDMRMMGQHDPRRAGEASPLDGVSEIDPAVSGVPLTCEQLEPDLYFDAAGDVDRLEGRGVGVPCDDFKRSGP